MIDGISSSSFDYQLNSMSNTSSSSNSLSLEQQQTIEDVLSNYDASSLSESDAAEIVSAFQNAGIEPSKEMDDAMDSLGFDAGEIGVLAGATQQAGMPPPPPGGMPPPPPSESDEEEFDTVSSLLETLFESDDETEDSEESAASSFDDLMEYTSRIVNLNESSKENVMEMLEKYGSEDNGLSQEETNSIVKSTLNSILGESNNYNHTSFYG